MLAEGTSSKFIRPATAVLPTRSGEAACKPDPNEQDHGSQYPGNEVAVSRCGKEAELGKNGAADNGVHDADEEV